MKKYLFIIVLVLFAAATRGQGVSKLFGLVGGYPQANQSSNGFLFSTDSSGNNFQVQYNFPVTVSGGLPANLEMAAYNGKLYGTTMQGGSGNNGTIFEYDPATNIYIKKFEFGPDLGATGGTPRGSLLLYNNKFYGLAADYGTSSGGCLFEWDPATNIYTKKFDFTNAGGSYSGSHPQNSLRLCNGKMYGTTQQGGANSLGVVFEWDPATNIYRDLYDGDLVTGREFYNNLTVYNNKLYGASYSGGATNWGALFVIDPALPNGSNYTLLKNFDYSTNGGHVNNNEMIVYNNKLYGCLNEGGVNGVGTLFEFDPATTAFTKLVDFNYTPTGGSPSGKLVANGAKFLGLCSIGGVNGKGTVYEWDPASPNIVTKKNDFGVSNLDNPINPGSTLTLFNSKFYAVSYNGGFVNRGALFEYDYGANTITKKINFDAAETGRIPYGKPLLYNGKLYGTCLYGPQEDGGTPYGCLWSFDPSTATYTRKFNFDYANNSANGRAPVSSPIAYNGKLYGTTANGGINDWGLLYEYDPEANTYTKKDMQSLGVQYPAAEPILFNNKIYGMTNAGGIGNNGIIYCYDPATGVLSKVYDLNTIGSGAPSCGFTVYNNKLYATTRNGGANAIGAIFSFDPATNTATSLYDIQNATGQNVINVMTVYNNKLYGTSTGGGIYGRGCIFEFNPSTNALAVVHHFISGGPAGYDPQGELTLSGNKLYCLTRGIGNIINVVELDPAASTVTTKSTYTTTNFNGLVAHNGLAVVPAFIANGTPGSCENYPTIVINGSNNTQWVPILNTAGDVVAEIRANGNNLGNVTASTYINNGTIREDAQHQMYLDRNISFVVQNQPASGVDIRLYIKTSEYLALKNAVNSQGQPSTIASINDVTVLKTPQTCDAAITGSPVKLATVPSAYEYGYVFSATVNSFSTFYFASKTFVVLPIRLISFDAVKQGHSVKLNWQTENEINFARFEVERSNDARNFTSIATVSARGNALSSTYTINDDHPFAGSNYYRLKQIGKDGTFTYSNIVRVDFNSRNDIVISPNPAHEYIIITGAAAFKQVQILDVAGKTVKQMNVAADSRYSVSGLSKGIYFVRLTGTGETVTNSIVIE